MSSRTPTIKLVSFAGAVPHVTVLVALMVLGWWLNRSNGPLIGLGLFLVLRFALRAIPHDHRSAIAFVRKHRFSDAIPCFRRSLDFFDRHPWLDKYRSLLLLSPSGASYREMALANMGFCYSQVGDGHNARSQYQQCLERFPDSGLAQTALNMMDSVTQNP